MGEKIQVLIVEDHPDDAELMVRELRRAGFTPEWVRVETESAYLSALEQNPDVILSDSSLPVFNPELHQPQQSRNGKTEQSCEEIAHPGLAYG